MSDYESKVKTKVGELTVHFNDKSDLETKLLQIPEFVSAIEDKLGAILVREPERVIPSFEDIYTIAPDGSIKLLKYPKQKTDLLRLAAFLSPTALNAAQLKQITGVDNPKAYLGKDFTPNPDDSYSLSSDGRTEVANKIIPALRAGKMQS
jgi:hypothetical protein